VLLQDTDISPELTASLAKDEGARANQHPPMQQLAFLSMGWAAFFHLVSISQLFLKFLTNEFFLGCFFFNPDLHTISPPSYPTDVAILLTRLPY
jgi:hypothetical protein